MRIVSLIVVVGSLLWLLAASQGVRMKDLDLFGISPDSVSGTIVEDGAKDSSIDEIAYRDLYPMLASIEASEALDRISAVALVRSSLDVAPEDIKLQLNHGGEDFAIAVGQYGDVIIPANVTWRDDEATVRSNQPAGSLSMQVTFILETFPGRTVRYAWLLESMDQLQAAMGAMDDAMGAPPRQVSGLIFEFPRGKEGAVRFLGLEDDPILPADEQGVLRVPRDEALQAADPELQFNIPPERMLPLLTGPTPGDT